MDERSQPAQRRDSQRGVRRRPITDRQWCISINIEQWPARCWTLVASAVRSTITDIHYIHKLYHHLHDNYYNRADPHVVNHFHNLYCPDDNNELDHDYDGCPYHDHYGPTARGSIPR